jgi:integrase
MTRHQNHGIRKTCDCGRRRWSTCPHSWKLNFKWADKHYRLAIDREIGERIPDRNKAKAAADTIRTAIRNGTFRQKAPEAAAPANLTFAAFGTKWIEGERTGKVRKVGNDTACLATLGAVEIELGVTLATRPIGRITEDDIERVFAALRTTKAVSTRNHYLQTIKSLEKWGRRKGYLVRPWLGEFTSLKREKHARRDRRLVADSLTKAGQVKEPGEERRLLAAATPWLQRLIIAALETGCRRGELLSLQWQDVDQARNELTIRAEKAKDGDMRTLPISARLKGVLAMIRHAPDGKEHSATAFVFGDAVGGQVADPKKAWTKTCRTAGIVDLHFHDLRHEAGSRMLEAGWPIHHVQQMLGHADLKQTSTYLNVTRVGLQDSMRRFGTEPLHAVAPEAVEEHPPTGNAETDTSQKHLVN